MPLQQPIVTSSLLSIVAFAFYFFVPSFESDFCDCSALSISGKVIDSETHSPIPNCHYDCDYVQSSFMVFGLDFGNSKSQKSILSHLHLLSQLISSVLFQKSLLE